MIQIQQWYALKRILITDEENQGSVQVGIPDNTIEKSRLDGVADALIFSLWVNEPYRGRGTAKRLLEKAECEAKKQGCKTVCLEWDKREAPQWAYDWYERQGYNELEFGRYSSLFVKNI